MWRSHVSNRYFWKTMRSDVVKWIKNCPQCSSRKRKPAEMGAESHLEALSLPQVHDDVDRCVRPGLQPLVQRSTRSRMRQEFVHLIDLQPLSLQQKECMYVYAGMNKYSTMTNTFSVCIQWE